jgi:hypothetical protein
MYLRTAGLSWPRWASVAVAGAVIGLCMLVPAQAPAATAAHHQAAVPIAGHGIVADSSGASRVAIARRTAWSPVSSLIRKLLGHVVIRGGKKVAFKYAYHWSRQQLINSYCFSWYRYFGYRYGTWAYYARYYWGPRWAWYFCDAYWR